jgi:hypothetical protein
MRLGLPQGVTIFSSSNTLVDHRFSGTFYIKKGKILLITKDSKELFLKLVKSSIIYRISSLNKGVRDKMFLKVVENVYRDFQYF